MILRTYAHRVRYYTDILRLRYGHSLCVYITLLCLHWIRSPNISGLFDVDLNRHEYLKEFIKCQIQNQIVILIQIWIFRSSKLCRVYNNKFWFPVVYFFRFLHFYSEEYVKWVMMNSFFWLLQELKESQSPFFRPCHPTLSRESSQSSSF